MSASVAVVGAGVIAVNPIASNTAALDIQHRAVDLVASVTDSPDVVYGDLFNNTITSLTGLGNQIAAHPLPILSAIVQNQVGYATKVSNALTASGTALQTWWETGSRESPPGKTLLANIQAALAAGDVGLAYDNFNKLALFGIQNSILPILNGTIFTSGTNLGIPQQMAQNFADAIGAVLNTGTIAFGAFASIYAPISGAAFEGSRALEAVGAALSTGDVLGAATALINTPGVVTDAFLNGFDYNDGDTTAPWVGLLSPPGTGPRPTAGGPFQQFLVTIPGKIAAAIINPTVVPTGTAVASLALPAANSATVQTFDLKVGDDAAETAATVASTPAVADAPAADVAEDTAGDATDVAPATATKTTKHTAGAKSFTDRLDAAAKKFGGDSKKSTSTSSDDSSATSGAKADSSPKTSSKKSSGRHAKADS